jgi:hypothetical protein
MNGISDFHSTAVVVATQAAISISQQTAIAQTRH